MADDSRTTGALPDIAFPPYRGPGWRIGRVIPPRRRGDWWVVEAIYAGWADMGIDDPRPNYLRFAQGSTEAEARAKVLTACAADKDWPLMLEDVKDGR